MAKGEKLMTDEIVVKEIEQEINTVGGQALSLVVKDNATYSQAGGILVLHKNLEKKIKAYFKPLKDSAHKAWKIICNRENEEIEKLEPAIKHLNKQMTTWNLEQERIRKEQEDKLRREAEKAEEERRLQSALEAEKAGAKEEAEAILNEPVFVPPPIVEKTTPKVAGQSMTTTWRWKLEDINLVPRQYLTTNDTAINAVVRSLKDKTNIAGIKIYPESSMRGVRQ